MSGGAHHKHFFGEHEGCHRTPPTTPTSHGLVFYLHIIELGSLVLDGALGNLMFTFSNRWHTAANVTCRNIQRGGFFV